MAEKTEKKPSSIQRLFEFAGNYKYLAVASWILAAISAFCRTCSILLYMETDQRSTSCCTGLCEDTANGSRLEPVDSRKTSGDRKKATFSRLHWSFLFYFL